MPACLTIARKEIRDHLRDLRSLSSTALYALMGPAVVMLVAFAPAAAGSRGPTLLLSMSSVFALVAAFGGGMNVALDATAGERERRSLVPLLLNPVSSLDLVIGKWLATSVFGLGSVALNLAGFVAVLSWSAFGPLHASAASLAIWVVLGLAPLALLGSAVQLAVAANSRSAKEAHSWLSMLVFLPMLIGMFIVFFPGWMGDWWMITPIVGQQLLIARGLDGSPSLLPAVVLATATLVAAVPALLAARGVLNRYDAAVG